MLGSKARWQTVAFMGWFGPRGLATVVFTILLIDAAVPNGNIIASAAIVGVTLSVFAHGFTAPPLVARYAALVVVGLGRAGHADGGAPGRRASRAPGIGSRANGVEGMSGPSATRRERP